MTFKPQDYLPPDPENIRKARKRVFLTQEACASMVGVSRRTWIRYESGDVDMPRTALMAFCHLLNLNSETLEKM